MRKNICDINLLLEHGVISRLDYYFARYLCETANETDPVVRMSCALVSRAVSQGHICLEIDYLAGRSLQMHDSESSIKAFILPDKKSWSKALRQSKIVADTPCLPLVYESDQRLYLAKYYNFQNRLTENIIQRVQQPGNRMHENVIQELVNARFPTVGKHKTGIDRQKKAVINSLIHPFSIISGGPGTGKTHITNSIIRLIRELPQFFGKSPRIICLAPTGKASVKLQDGMTIHRGLKYDPGRLFFGYHKNNPLPCDVVIVDEASMIDIALMTRLLEAIPMAAWLIMLGDHNQLSSVEAGAVFGDICRSNGLADYRTHLDYNFRSENKSGIDRMAKALQDQDHPEIKRLLDSDETGQIHYIRINDASDLEQLIRQPVLKGYESFVRETDPIRALETLDQFRILCAHRYGPFGSMALNVHCKNILRSSLNSDIQDRFFKQAVMISINSYSKNLFNGDTGIIYNEQGSLKAVFSQRDQKAVYFNPFELPVFEDAFAMTIHKSQGSEFNDVLLILPRASSFITRQLLYTGLTRAKKRVTIVGNSETILEASRQTINRHSNIPDLIDQQLDLKRYS